MDFLGVSLYPGKEMRFREVVGSALRDEVLLKASNKKLIRVHLVSKFKTNLQILIYEIPNNIDWPD
jgi:hypothetical protein